MNVWAISDLHLSFGRPERRDQYGGRWRDHADKIARGWREVVRPSDVVLLPGDFSMARNHRELQPDLEWLGALPGTKVLSPGNHDRWWNETEAVRRLLRRSMVAVGGDAAEVRDLVVCVHSGRTHVERRGRTRPTAYPPTASWSRSTALAAPGPGVAGLGGGGDRRIYVLWHFPPFDANGRPGPWVERFERAGVNACVYGHLHIQGQWSRAVQGEVRGVRYHCVAADALGFRPLRIDKPARSPGEPDDIAAHLTIVNRTIARAREFAGVIQDHTPASAAAIAWEGMYSVPEATDVVVNATSIGLVSRRLGPGRGPAPRRSTSAGVVCDVIPHPPRTLVLQEARANGFTILDSSGMLVNHGVIGVQLWSGRTPAAAVMRSALEAIFGGGPSLFEVLSLAPPSSSIASWRRSVRQSRVGDASHGSRPMGDEPGFPFLQWRS